MSSPPQGSLYPPLFPQDNNSNMYAQQATTNGQANTIGSIPISIAPSPAQNPTQSRIPQTMGFGNQPATNQLFADFGSDSMLTQAGLSYGAKMIGQGQTIVSNVATKYFSSLKYYYNVNNSYVVNNLRLILFPLRHKYWKRRIQRQGEGEVYLPPRDDINAPDLYIPTMAFVTYILIIGYVMGTAYKFTPEVLASTASKGLFMLMIEVLLIKFGFYLLNSFTVPILDLVAYCGYKYVGIVITVLGGFLFGRYAFYALLTLTTAFMAIFMVRTLKLVFPDASSSFAANTGMPSSSSKRNYFLLAIAVFQLIEGYYLSYDLTFE